MTTQHATDGLLEFHSFDQLAMLNDSELLARLGSLVSHEQGLTVAILMHLSEVERRELHLAKGCPSLFAYCVQRLGLSEDVAYKRVGAARYGRRFPMALDLLSRGELHLSALMLVGPHLTDANHQELLNAVAGKSKREVELLVATRYPKPDVPTSVRKLPERKARTQAVPNVAAAPPLTPQAESCPSSGTRAVGLPEPGHANATQLEAKCAAQPALTGITDAAVAPAAVTSAAVTPAAVTSAAVTPVAVTPVAVAPAAVTSAAVTPAAVIPASQSGTAADSQPSDLCTRPSDRPRVQPLSSSSYRIVFTASESLKKKLDRARELCSHSVAPADFPALLERALDLLIEREEQRRYAVLSPRPGKTRRNDVIGTRRAPVPRNQQDPDPLGPVEPEANEFSRHVPNEFSRHVPAAVRRALWERDGGHCTFVDDEGNRCAARDFLEIDHVDAYARGGPTAIRNCRLLCRAHNQYLAKLTFGTDLIVRARSRAATG